MTYFTYLLECSDKTYYCGYTNDLEKRLNSHNNSNLAAKYTRSRRPVKLVYTEEFPNKSLAMQREAAIKKLNRKQKEKLVLSYKS